MNKKFLSVILFGALMVATTGTFVSCKDYDDDVSNLQGQIDSQKSDLSSKVAAVESSISSLQAAQSGLESAIAAAKDEAEKAALAAQVKAIETASAELATVKAELQAAIKLNSDDVEAVKAAVAKANDDMSKAVGRIQTLEAFKTTTETALANLGDADVALTEKIEALNTELLALGGRLTAVEAQVAALEAYKTSNDAAVAGNTAAIDQLIADLNALEEGKLTDAMIQKIAEQVTEVVGAKLDIISAALNKKVTHVSLYVTAQDFGYTNLNLVSAEAVRTWTFGDKLDGTPVSFTEGDKETFEDSFIVRVSPTNATLDKSMIKLINSQLNDLNGLLVVENIEAYKDLVTTRGVSANGLWKVSVKLIDDYSADAYKAAASTYKTDGTADKNILYAVMIGDSVKDERQVVSEYGVTLGSAAKTVYRTLNFNVDETPVAEIKNRWGNTGNSYSEDATPVSYVERKWNLDLKYKPWAAPIFADAATPANINVLSADDDIRNGRAAYSVKAGKAFTVNYAETIAPNIRGFYVTLDGDCAVESAPSEINAWKSYGVKGLNTVTSESSLELTIPEDVNAEGDYIGFRVYAVNYDGSLVDPDGKAFYVYVGETDKNIANLTLTMDSKIVVPLTMTVASKADAFSTANWSRAKGGMYDLVIMEGETEVTNNFSATNFRFKNAEGGIVALLNNGNLNATDAITSVASVEMLNVVASTMKDGVTYTATITAKNGTSGIVAIATIKFTKTLPAFPTSVYPYTNILMNGNLKIYPIFNNNQAEFDMNNVWHGISRDVNGTITGFSSLIFSEIHAASVAATVSYAPLSNIISVPSSLVDPAKKAFGTKFPMAINYDYGQISKAYNAQTRAWEVVNHNPVYGQNFTAEFGNYVYDCTFAWKTAPKVTYPGAKGQPSYIALKDMKITDWYNAAVDLTKMTTAGSKEHKYMQAVSLNFLTGAEFNVPNEYYKFATYAKYDTATNVYADVTDIKDATHIKMMSQSEASQGNDVPTKIQLVFTDNFGFKVTKVMDTPFTMSFKQQ